MIGVLGFDSWRGLGIILFTSASRTASGPTQPPIQWVPGALSLSVKRPGSEADYSLSSNAEVKEYVELYLHSPNTLSYMQQVWCPSMLLLPPCFITNITERISIKFGIGGFCFKNVERIIFYW
jgi:hypothetical protein